MVNAFLLEAFSLSRQQKSKIIFKISPRCCCTFVVGFHGLELQLWEGLPVQSTEGKCNLHHCCSGGRPEMELGGPLGMQLT